MCQWAKCHTHKPQYILCLKQEQNNPLKVPQISESDSPQAIFLQSLSNKSSHLKDIMSSNPLNPSMLCVCLQGERQSSSLGCRTSSPPLAQLFSNPQETERLAELYGGSQDHQVKTSHTASGVCGCFSFCLKCSNTFVWQCMVISSFTGCFQVWLQVASAGRCHNCSIQRQIQRQFFLFKWFRPSD